MPQTPARSQFWLVLLTVGAVALLVALADAAYSMLGSNLREVLPGRLYRAAHPSRATLSEARDRHGVKTVLALRGVCDFESWYRDEVANAEDLGLSIEVVGLSAGRMPSRTAARDLCEILERAEPPLLVHCQRGIDRTGLVSALYLLLRTDATVVQARGQLSIRYLHMNAGRTRAMGRFLDLYEEWLAIKGCTHQPDHLRRWLMEEYRPPQGSAEIECLASLEEERIVVPAGIAKAIPVRVWNRSEQPLRFSPGLFGGVYLRWCVVRPDRTVLLESQPGGLRRANVVPGQSVDLHVYLPPIAQPGRYRLMVELFDQTVGSLAVYGCDPLTVELEVP